MENTNTLNSEKLLELERLSVKVASLQKEVEEFLPIAQGVLDKANFSLVFVGVIVTVLAIVVTGAGLFLQWWYAKDREEEIAKAKETIEESFAKGLFPEDSKIKTKLITAVLGSHEFNEALEKGGMFRNESEHVEGVEFLRSEGGSRIEYVKKPFIDSIKQN